ncbi:DUF3152 domain-containing protein [Streptomyces winkii]|uniref:DUF3152 domain-containing protein n=1 Tax=Streptomyces winkii TaxID=3051178 RepID=UPI0028D0809C|nr:DUF3152 domain-containing protein [Streptomyces sp. DSM 40971]
MSEADVAAYRPQPPYGPPDPRDASADGTPSPLRDRYRRGYRHGDVRGGHPEHREPGGGWGADASGRGPEGGTAAGRVLQGTPGGGALGMGLPAGPRQEYIDAFDDSVFGKGPNGGGPGGSATNSVRAPAPRHPGTRGGEPGRGPAPLPGRGQDLAQGLGGRRPGTPGPWNGYEGASASEPGGPADPEADGGIPHAPPPPRVPVQTPYSDRKGGSGKGKALTGVLAVAVTTVIAFAVAGQVTGAGQPGDDGTDDGAGGAERGLSADGPASRSEKSRGAAAEAKGAALSYTEKLSKTYSLDANFKGKGDFKAVAGSDEGVGASDVMRYRVDVEKGLPLESELFAQFVQKTLNDKRSWAHGGERSFERISKGKADFVITLASSPTTDVWCAKSGLDTSQDKVSCDSASTDRVMINAYRWAQGSKTFGDDKMLAYRQMLINHEVGHRLGRDHVGCPKDGALAPVMMQQTKSLTSGGDKCRPNPWPYPRS